MTPRRQFNIRVSDHGRTAIEKLAAEAGLGVAETTRQLLDQALADKRIRAAIIRDAKAPNL